MGERYTGGFGRIPTRESEDEREKSVRERERERGRPMMRGREKRLGLV